MDQERLLRFKEVMLIVGLSRSTIYCLIGQGRFPQQVLLGQRAVGWRESEVHAWVASRPMATERPATRKSKTF